MNHRRLIVNVGVVLAVVIVGAGVWEVMFDVQPRTRVARRLDFGFFEAGAIRALDDALKKAPEAMLSRLEPLLSDDDLWMRLAARDVAAEARGEIEGVAAQIAASAVWQKLRGDSSDAENWIQVAALLQESDPVDEHLRRAICKTAKRKKQEARVAIDAFMSVARDAAFAPVNRQTAVTVIGLIGEDAAPMLPDLLTLAASDPPLFEDVVREAHGRMIPRLTLEWFDLQLRSDENGYLLRWHFELGPEGRLLGPMIVEFLHDRDWSNRVAAARALGDIEYLEGIPALTRLLSDRDDWRLVATACLSLGQLRAEESLPELERVAREHWLPDVRGYAEWAMDVIVGRRDHVEAIQEMRSNRTYDAAEIGITKPIEPSAVQKLSSGPDRLSRWRTWWINRGIEYACNAGYPEEMFEWSNNPAFGVTFAGGFLLGGTKVDRGEFGTGVVVVKPDEIPEYIPGNVMAMHRMPFGVVIVSYPEWGNSMGWNTLLLAEEREDGRVTFRPFKRLPGGAERSGMLPGGDLFVGTEAGAVVITSDGEIRLAE